MRPMTARQAAPAVIGPSDPIAGEMFAAAATVKPSDAVRVLKIENFFTSI
jgi:hypothetical protein